MLFGCIVVDVLVILFVALCHLSRLVDCIVWVVLHREFLSIKTPVRRLFLYNYCNVDSIILALWVTYSVRRKLERWIFEIYRTLLFQSCIEVSSLCLCLKRLQTEGSKCVTADLIFVINSRSAPAAPCLCSSLHGLRMVSCSSGAKQIRWTYRWLTIAPLCGRLQY